MTISNRYPVKGIDMNLGDQEESPWDDVPSSSKPSTPLPTNNGDPLAQAAPANASASESARPAVTTNAPSKTPGGGRGARKRTPAPQIALEAADDPLAGPLGGTTAEPAHEEPDEPPELPQKEQRPVQAASPTVARPVRRSVPQGQEEDAGVNRPGSQQGMPGSGEGPRSQQSISIEQASKPSFRITVGDPHKVGDFAGSHTVYQVRTRTTSKAYRNPEFEVSRRYRDFLWLYNQLHSNNPGTIVPPPPEKQAVGRFETDFVESRRSALERMLTKACAHPILQHDADLKLFLESETFNIDRKDRERGNIEVTESKGVFGGLNLSVGAGTKFIEHDDWFLDRRAYLDQLEVQLKALLKASDTAVAQRKGLSDAAGELSESLNTLSQVELSPSLSGPLAGLSDLHVRIRDLYERQAIHDGLNFGNTIDEYVRIVASIKKAFEQRQRSWQTFHNADSDLAKRRSALDKLMRQGRSQTDKMNQLQADVADAERRAHQMRLQFDDLGRGMRVELERFEHEKVEDFARSAESMLETNIESQKELIELWETYLFHLDADEEEDFAAAKSSSNAHDLPVRPAENAQAPQQPTAGADDDEGLAVASTGDAAISERVQASPTAAEA